LLDALLEETDPVLWSHFQSKQLKPQMYAFPSKRKLYFDCSQTLFIAIMTFCACTEPLDEAIMIWDYFIAQGFTMNVFSALAQLQAMRDDLLKSPR
jgi:cell cycle arrest protein BUB2